ncbi:glycosyltransferase family 2 protein [Hansschlegelia sp.]|uniref:glycosyltransferase family 2 protein n=1 Tax=Hansschlegelia sp. TaxID=2041892 RepID=UPI002B7FC638|nr:glycosyltransferase [Hansschlegelia sp.]HVI30109.1 glycosyltransferase [Hansschlegelia sp.]
MALAENMLPPVTFIVEWENAIDVEDEWAKRAMSSFQSELERNQSRMTEKPRVMYLYDRGAVDAETIQSVIDEVAPRLKEFAEVELVATPGLTYYKLKNYGVSLAKTELVVMLDSDAGPQPGWLEALLKPFADPEIMAVGGFTVLGHEDLLSRTMALSWIFNLPSERTKTVKRHKIHANNCAFRTEFFRRNPFPDLPAFKKQCGFWLRDISARGYKWVRTADAMTIHAPHPGYKFIAWRAWTTGLDRDFQAFHTVTQSRLGRLGYSFYFFGSKLWRSWKRIIKKGGEVDLPVWQRPFAMLLSLGYFSIALVGELWSALTRSFGPLPATGSNQPPLAAPGQA